MQPVALCQIAVKHNNITKQEARCVTPSGLPEPRDRDQDGPDSYIVPFAGRLRETSHAVQSGGQSDIDAYLYTALRANRETNFRDLLELHILYFSNLVEKIVFELASALTLIECACALIYSCIAN